jgi:hypothetical protein
VADGAFERARRACQADLAGRVEVLVAEARQAGLGVKELLVLVQECWAEKQP